MKVVKLLDQASKDGSRGSLREQVGEHHDAGEVLDRDNATVDEIAKELGASYKENAKWRLRHIQNFHGIVLSLALGRRAFPHTHGFSAMPW